MIVMAVVFESPNFARERINTKGLGTTPLLPKTKTSMCFIVRVLQSLSWDVPIAQRMPRLGAFL